MKALDMATREDLKRLTGLQKPSAIKRYLANQNIPYMVGADGWPRVLHAIILERLGGPLLQTPSKHDEPELILD